VARHSNLSQDNKGRASLPGTVCKTKRRADHKALARPKLRAALSLPDLPRQSFARPKGRALLPGTADKTKRLAGGKIPKNFYEFSAKQARKRAIASTL